MLNEIIYQHEEDLKALSVRERDDGGLDASALIIEDHTVLSAITVRLPEDECVKLANAILAKYATKETRDD